MKKILFSMALLGIAISTHAQVNSLGPTVGFNYAWLSDNPNGDPRPSINVGLIYNYSIFESSGIGFEARYSQEGSQTKIGNRTYINEMNYIRVPLKFTYYFGDLEDKVRPKIFAGPSFAFLIGGKSQTQVGENIVTVKSTDVYNAFDFGIQAGAGLNFHIAKMTWLNFDVAYTHGLTNVVSENVIDKPKNRLVNVNLGVAFGF